MCRHNTHVVYVYLYSLSQWGDIYRAHTANHETRIVLELSESNVIKSYFVHEMELDHSKMYEAAKMYISNREMRSACDAEQKWMW